MMGMSPMGAHLYILLVLIIVNRVRKITLSTDQFWGELWPYSLTDLQNHTPFHWLKINDTLFTDQLTKWHPVSLTKNKWHWPTYKITDKTDKKEYYLRLLNFKSDAYH